MRHRADGPTVYPWQQPITVPPSPPWDPEVGSMFGICVVEQPNLVPFDAMHRAGPHIVVGELAHLRWRVWLEQYRAEAIAEATQIVRDGLARFTHSDQHQESTHGR